MAYTLTITGFNKDFENTTTAREIAKQLLQCGIYTMQTGLVKKNNKTTAFVAVKSQDIQFDNFPALNNSLKLLEALSRSTKISFTIKGEN
jgi:hypothetical protein